MIIGLDTETTGLDLYHGCKPFLVTITKENDEQIWWEWEVNPITRQPIVPKRDLIAIQQEIDTADLMVLQNPNFDERALQTVFKGELRWDWSKVRDTLLAAHLLHSNKPKDLTTLVLTNLGMDISKFDKELCKACNEARRFARAEYPEWRIAKEGLPEMPSAKATVWKQDMWLLRAIALRKRFARDHPYWTLCSDYANVDSAACLHVYRKQMTELKERGLFAIYMERLKLLPIANTMQKTGITLSGTRLDELIAEYREEAETAGAICTNIAKGFDYELSLPKSGNNKSLSTFVFDVLKLPVVIKSKKTGAPSLNKQVIEHYLSDLPQRSKGYTFVKRLQAKRKRDTAIAYMESYKKFRKPVRDKYSNWFILHPGLNPTGTDTLRWSSSNPNQQNISKQEGFNLRYCFGPAPGREWWSLDANNIELRLPAYEAGEEEMIALFDKPNDPPYYGSNHLLIFDVLHPKMFAKYGANVKKKYAATWYQWTKNGNFAVQYGAVEASGTADRAYHVKGAQHKIQKRFSKIAKLNKELIDFANIHGYVPTMPDKTVDPKKGYPLLCPRSKWEDVLPTVPLNYHIQGTACWWMGKAMIRCQRYLDKLNRYSVAMGGSKYFMIMQVHDELVFDFPKENHKGGNRHIVNTLQKLMEQGGDDIGVPTPVGIEYHPNTWSESE